MEKKKHIYGNGGSGEVEDDVLLSTSRAWNGNGI